MKALSVTAAAFLLFMIGCSQSARGPVPNKDSAKNSATPAVAATDWAAESAPKDSEEFVAQEQADGNAGGQGLIAGAQPAVGGKPKPAQQKVARKIKYTADLKLITDEFDKTRDELQILIEKHQGYEAMADVRSSPGSQRVGTWKVRVPIENFAAFRTSIRKLVESKLADVEVDTVNTEDLTEQYYDLDANIKNLKAEQDSWREMLKRTSDKLENLITVKRELDRVTDEIQRKEGRLRLMANLTDLTTVNLSLRERQKFTPDKGPDVAEAATFGMKAGKTFDDSWSALRGFGQGLALIAIALAPWLPVLLLVGIPCWYYVRRAIRTAPTAAVPAAAAPST